MTRLLCLAPLLALAACGDSPRQIGLPGDDVNAPEAAGPYLVFERDLPDGLGRLYLPSTRSDAADARVFPVPLLVFTPGFSSGEADYRRTSRYVASHGFAVLGANHGFDFASATLCATQADGFDRVTRALATVRGWSGQPGDLQGMLDGRVATAGHSYGGKLALWRAALDDDVVVAIALDPVDGGDERRPGWCGAADGEGFPTLGSLFEGAALPPTLMVSAGKAGDCAPPEGNAFVLYELFESQVTHAFLPGAAHQHFVDAAEDEDCFGCGLCPAGDDDPADVLQVSRASLVAMLHVYAAGDDRYAAFLDEAVDGSVWQPPPSIELSSK